MKTNSSKKTWNIGQNIWFVLYTVLVLGWAVYSLIQDPTAWSNIVNALLAVASTYFLFTMLTSYKKSAMLLFIILATFIFVINISTGNILPGIVGLILQLINFEMSNPMLD